MAGSGTPGAAGAGVAPVGGAPSAAGAGNAPAAGAGSQIAIKVSFELDTMDGLRKVIFGLEEDTRGADKIWTIHFQLQERTTSTPATTPFVNVVTLDVTVDDAALHPAATAAAANNSLTPPQAAHALGPAADDAKNSTTPESDPDHVDPADAKDTVRNTLAQ